MKKTRMSSEQIHDYQDANKEAQEVHDAMSEIDGQGRGRPVYDAGHVPIIENQLST